MTKPRILEAVREAKGEPVGAGFIDHLKKAEMAKETADPNGRALGIELILPDWFYAGVLEDALVLTIDRAYFSLTGGLERWLYRIVRKHGGRQDYGWSFDFAISTPSPAASRRSSISPTTFAISFAASRCQATASRSIGPSQAQSGCPSNPRPSIRWLKRRVAERLRACWGQAMNSLVLSGTAPIVPSGTGSTCYRGPESLEKPSNSDGWGVRNFSKVVWTNLIKHEAVRRELTIDLKFLAVFSHRRANRLKSLRRADTLLDASTVLVEGSREEGRLVFFVSFVRDDWGDAARPCRLAVGLAGVAFVGDGGAGLDVGSDVEQGFEVTPVGSFSAGQVEGDDVAGGVRFCVDFRGEAAARTSERLPVLPPFAPAADTCARTMVKSNI